MLFFLISTFSFALLLSKSFPLQPLPSWANDMRLLSLLFYKEAIHFLLQYVRSKRQLIVSTILAMTISRKKHAASKSFELEESVRMSVLDLPDLALECILSRLPPEGLCNMAVVCKELKERCTSDHLWEKHMQEKWGRLIGVAGKKAWQSYVASKRAEFDSRSGKNKGLVKSLSRVWSLTWMRSKLGSGRKPRSYLPMDTVMSCYMSLESGKFWFPAQVYNREHGHVGFMLSCYDAELSYDWCTDSFNARYPPHGRRTAVIEEGVQWERLRAPPVETAPHDLHISDCLNELRPGDHIEIQWRRNKEFPYGWWYGVVGHLDTCDGTELHCRCHKSDTVALEFNQYTVGSRWRRTLINRKEHLEHGNEMDGFYGGIRRLQCKEEISLWRKLWPRDILD